MRPCDTQLQLTHVYTTVSMQNSFILRACNLCSLCTKAACEQRTTQHVMFTLTYDINFPVQDVSGVSISHDSAQDVGCQDTFTSAACQGIPQQNAQHEGVCLAHLHIPFMQRQVMLVQQESISIALDGISGDRGEGSWGRWSE